MRHRRIAALAAVLAAAVLALACLHQLPTASGSRRPLSPAVPAADQEAKSLLLPVDDYTLDTPQTALILSAEDQLTAACMARLHLKWPQLTRHPSPFTPNRLRYGPIEPQVAARYGYHELPDPDLSRREQQSAARDAGLSPRQRTAAYGTPHRPGCRSQARTRLLAQVPDVPWDLLNQITTTSYDLARQSPAVTTAGRRWSTCMRRRGFHYADPATAADDPRWNTRLASRAEIATARADVACKQLTGLVRTWWRTETALQNEAIARHARQFRAIAAARNQYLTRARQVLTSTSAADTAALFRDPARPSTHDGAKHDEHVQKPR
ncbi:hypothetical protein [Streptomyces sp. NPDC002172]